LSMLHRKPVPLEALDELNLPSLPSEPNLKTLLWIPLQLLAKSWKPKPKVCPQVRSKTLKRLLNSAELNSLWTQQFLSQSLTRINQGIHLKLSKLKIFSP